MAYGWTVTAGVDDEADEWTSALNQSTLNSDQTSWQIKPSILSPNASAAVGIMNFGGWAAEEFNIVPELVTANPENVQDDQDSWTVMSAPD